MSTHDPEAIVKQCYSTWSESYYDEYYGEKAPYPPVHSEHVKRLLRESGARTILDAGCGPASFLRELRDEDVDLYGFDLTPEMVVEARRVLDGRGTVWEGSVLDSAAFSPPGGRPARFDAAVCIGVLPHVPPESDRIVLGNLRGAVRDGGLVIVEARNQLFALYTLNRYSLEFFRDVLIDVSGLRTRAGGESAALEEAIAELGQRFRTDLPPIRAGSAGEPGYDEILSRTHNPLVLREQFVSQGFDGVRVLYYHFHALPPLLESAVPDLLRRESLALERNPQDWRGLFMASAFLLVGRRS